MRKYLKLLEPIGVVLIALLAVFLGVGDASVYGAEVTTLAGGGAVVTGKPLTLQTTDEASPDLRITDIDKRITRMKPMATPIDQISRHATALKAEAMEVQYYSVDQKGIKTTTNDAYAEPAGTVGAYATDNHKRATLAVTDNSMFEISDTIRVKGQKGYKADGTTASVEDLVLLVVSKSDAGAPIVVATNGKSIASNGNGGVITQCVPSIATGKTLIRLGQAAAERDVPRARFKPNQTERQYCQIYKMQVEQGTFNKMAKKEVDWDFSELEEDEIYDMRLTMENSMLFGVKGKTYDPIKKSTVYTSGGLWYMAGIDIYYAANTNGQNSENTVMELFIKIFEGDSGNKKKILFAGSRLMAILTNGKMSYMRTAHNITLWDLTFTEIYTNIGKILLFHHELFDMNDMSEEGFVLDPEYLKKKTLKSWDQSALELKTSGFLNANAVYLSEASCLYLRHPRAHARIHPVVKNTQEV